MTAFKNFIKELKRVRWPKSSDAWKTFFKVFIFIVIAALVFFAISIAFTSLWGSIGVGLNG